MKAKHLTIALITGFTLAPLAWAQGEEENGATEEPKVEAKVLRRKMSDEIPGEKMAVQQWKVPPLFFERDDDSTEEKPDPRFVLREHGVSFPSGATASYSPKNGKLTVKNTPRNLELIDLTIKYYMSRYRPVGRTAEDFKKWAKQEYKRRQEAVKLMKKVHDYKSAKKALGKLMKIYEAKKEPDTAIVPFRSCYVGTLKVIDKKTRDAVGEKFAKQLGEIYDQQNRLSGLEDYDDEDYNDEIDSLYFYTTFIYHFAEDDKTGERWEIERSGIKVKQAGESDD